MNVFRSQGQPELTHALLTEKDVRDLLEALRKTKNETARVFRRELKKVLK